MKKTIKRSAALLLAASLTLTSAAYASEALGTELRNKTTTVGQGTTVTNQSLWSATYSDLRTENYITYTPGGNVRPVVSYGTYVISTATLETMAADLEAQGLRVVGGINAGFFNSNGSPIGLVVTDGKLQSCANGNNNYYAIGFRADGTAFIGQPVLTVTATWETPESYTVDETTGAEVYVPAATQNITMSGVNKVRADGGYYLYTDTFSTTTKNNVSGVDVVLRPVDTVDAITGEVTAGASYLTIGGTVTCEVVSVRDSVTDNSIPSGCFVISMNSNSAEDKLAVLSALQTGTQVTISVTAADSVWNEAVEAVSGLYSLVSNGQKTTSTLNTNRNPYTAVGIKSDGSMVFYTIDGRQSGYSVGATYSQVAERMIELGCVDVIALDGGGSTSFGTTYADQTSFDMTNKSSDGSPRKVSTCLFLVTDAGASGTLQEFYVSSPNDLVLAGASLPLTVTGVDTNYYPMEYSGDLTWAASQGTVTYTDETGWVYTANTGGSTNVTDTVTVSGDGVTGFTQIKVIEQLTGITVRNESSSAAVASLNLTPSDVVDLSATGIYYNMNVQAEDTNFTWTADPSIGTIDENGVFTAGKVNATGNITVTGGGKTVTIPVTITGGDPFVDTEGHWAQDFVTQLYLLGITTGVTEADGQVYFYPNRTITRGELLTLVVRMMGVDATQFANVTLPFADTESIDKNWLLPYVQAAYSLGIFTGAERGGALYADVSTPVTRESAMTIIGRTLGYTQTADLSGYADGEQVSDWAETYVQTLVALGVVQGSDGNLSPQANITRGEIAKIISVTVTLPPQESDPEEEETTDPSEPSDPEETTDPAEEKVFALSGTAAVLLTDGTTGNSVQVTDAEKVAALVAGFEGAVYRQDETAATGTWAYELQFYDAAGNLLDSCRVVSETVVECGGTPYTWQSGAQPDLYYLGGLLIQ